MSQSVALTIGVKVIYDGEMWTISAFSGPHLQLTRPGLAPILIRSAELVGAADFRLASDEAPPLEAIGPAFSTLSKEDYESLKEREAHILEMTTGYRRGSAELALPGEPRLAYGPSVSAMMKYQAKAEELGLSVPTIRRMAKRYDEEGPAGLLDNRGQRESSPTGRVDEVWLEIAREVIAEHVDLSQPSKQLIFDRVNARVRARHGKSAPVPSRSAAMRVLKELTRGQQAFAGESAKQKRSIAGRPATPYGHLRAERIGEYVLLDTTKLDVFALDRLTLRWVPLELTIALDLCTRSIVGVRLSPVSTKAVDAALVLFETLTANSRSHTSMGLLPYGGVPKVLLVDSELVDMDSAAGLPGTATETIVIDHGKIYMSEHVRAVCERLGISIQPARVLTSTDKAVVERFFRTLREDLLNALPGYKGPDVYSRGKDAEGQAFYFIDEMEALIRDWLVRRYHTSVHDGVREPSVPRLPLSPNDMWNMRAATHGTLQVPRRADLTLDFLPVAWRTIQHYGVEVNGLRYDGPALEGFRGVSSPYAKQGGKWPIRFDPEDGARVYFQRPDDLSWSQLRWEHAREFTAPFSVEALKYARQLAASEGRHPDDRRALAELLERWDAGLSLNPNERRMALRLAEQRAARVQFSTEADSLSEAKEPIGPPPLSLVGDDDEPEEISADFYADAMGTGR